MGLAPSAAALREENTVRKLRRARDTAANEELADLSKGLWRPIDEPFRMFFVFTSVKEVMFSVAPICLSVSDSKTTAQILMKFSGKTRNDTRDN